MSFMAKLTFRKIQSLRLCRCLPLKFPNPYSSNSTTLQNDEISSTQRINDTRLVLDACHARRLWSAKRWLQFNDRIDRAPCSSNRPGVNLRNLKCWNCNRLQSWPEDCVPSAILWERATPGPFRRGKLRPTLFGSGDSWRGNLHLQPDQTSESAS